MEFPINPSTEAKLSKNSFADWTDKMKNSIEDNAELKQTIEDNAELKQTLENNLVKFNQAEKSFGIGSMDIQKISNATHIITIKDTDNNDKDVTDDFVYEPILKKAPEAVWGKSFKAKLNSDNGLIDNMLMGFRITPKPKKKPDQTEDKPVSDFSYDIELKDKAYNWTGPLQFTQENPDNDKSRRTTIQGISSNTARDAILKDLGFDAEALDFAGLASGTADAFLVAPEVLRAA